MVEENKRLVEVEYILRKLDADYINKIPKEIWDYIEKNKDKDYLFNYDENKILTYINIKYLLDEQHKKEMLEILREDIAFSEQEKAKLYTKNELFKDKKQEITLIEVKEKNGTENCLISLEKY